MPIPTAPLTSLLYVKLYAVNPYSIVYQKDRKKANYILRKADFIKAEPWICDWKVLVYGIDYPLMNGYDTDVPSFSCSSCENTPEEFNKIMKEILHRLILVDNDLTNSVLHNIDYQRFKDIDTKQS